MIVFKEEEPQPLAREFLEIEWRMFVGVCKLYGFRRPPIGKSTFMATMKNRYKEKMRVLKKIETM